MKITEREKRESAREYAFRTIKQNIISLDLEPGTTVSENELAAEMGISRTPVREALIELSKLNIVEIYPQRGSVISLIDSELVDEIRFLRQTLETAMVEQACDTASEHDLLMLEENLRMQEYYLEHEQLDKQFQLDDKFHELLYKTCNKNMVYRLLGDLMAHFDRVRSLSLIVIKDKKVISDHRSIVEAIRNKDKTAAKEIISKHLSRYIVDEKELKMKYPHYFK
ncbi:GntR family transcriptional regulator [Anaerobium acetethylicum]|uniref:DNA-binding transcriptional regulator, GntR family n=1 Tax=Anaerobium acetethylicum TaxID=1619234 RepID=A0A1D3TY37_9FIRM|nr:GntR family transcriptional regulator [Anaerobium acetethylicum]SCP99340.1 DNA-binding transcriptional regulator, GntR family [Anaerobium acetethylicum]